MQMGKFEKAIEYGKKGIELASSELSIRLGSKIDHNNKAKVYKIKRMFETIVLLFIDMGLAHEGKKEFLNMETALITGDWIANHYLRDKNDVKKSIIYILHKMRIKHSRYINIEKEKRKNEIKKKRLIFKNNATAENDLAYYLINKNDIQNNNKILKDK